MITTNLRIVVSGPAGSGKSTLAKALARKFELPALEEGMKDIYSAATAFGERKKDQSATKADIEHALRDWMSSFLNWAEQRKKQYATHDGFVADKWEADLLSVWLRNFSRYKIDKTTLRLRQDMRVKASTLGFAVVLPLQRGVIEDRNEDGLVRNQSFSTRLMASLLTLGLIRQCPDLPIIFVPNRALSVEERIDFVENMIRKQLASAASARSATRGDQR